MYKILFNQNLNLVSRFKLVLFILLAFFSNVANVKAQTPVQVVIGTTAGTGNWFFGPIMRNTGNSGLLNYSRHAYIYTAAELGIPSGAKIIKMEWLKKDGPSITGNNNFNVWLTNTTSATLPTTAAWSTLVTGATQVYGSSTYTVSASTNTYIDAPFNQASPADSFQYSGGNLQVLCDWGKLGTVNGTVGVNFYVLAATGKAIGIASTTQPVGSTVLQAATYGNARPTLRITYVPVPVCTGIPNTGAALSSASSACAGVSFSLSIQNTIPGTGVSYVWQKATNIGFTSGVSTVGTSSTLTTSETASFYYRCTATCSGSGFTNSSTPVFVPLSPHYQCYCASAASSAADEEIYNVTFGSLNNSSNCSTTALGIGSVPQTYSNYQYITPPNVEKLSTVPFSVQIGICSTNVYSNRTIIYIDYNQNGVFEASEVVYTSPNAVSGPHTESGSVVIPATALNGLTGMRVITSEQGNAFNTSTIQCANPSSTINYSWGETEDYLVNITPTTICSGAPTPGNTMSNLSSVCSGKTVNLSLQNLTTGQGVTYQWYNSSGIIAGATSFAYTSVPLTSPQTFYCAVKCTSSNLTTNSTPITITMNGFVNCYCTSLPGNDADEDIFKFTFNGGIYFTDCNTVAPGLGSILGRYSNFHTLGNIDTLDLGATVPFDLETDDCDQAPYYSFGTAIWIDFNHNGSFSDFGELVFLEPSALEGPRHIINNLVIPCNAMVGQTGMRVTIAEGLAGSNLSPCLLYGFGETEDYLISLKYPDTCSVVSNPPGNTMATVTSFCDSASSVLSLQNKCMFDNFFYQWYSGNYPGTIIAGATSKTYTTPVLHNTTTYYCSVTCGSSTVISTPITIHHVVITPTTVATASSSYCLGGTPVILSTTHTFTGVPTATNYTYSPTTSLSPVSGAIVSATPTVTTTYTITATDINGCFGKTTKTVTSTRLNVDLVASSPSYCFPGGSPVTLTSSASGGAVFGYSPTTWLSSDSGAVVTATPLVTTTYIVTGKDTTGCTGYDTITVTSGPCSITLNLKLYIQGYYAGLGFMNPVLMNQGIGASTTVTDSIDVELHAAASPYGLISSKRVILNTNGTATANYPGVPIGSYYIAVKHRNALQTWSANPVLVNNTTYNFSDNSNKAYGDNMFQEAPGVWAFYSGDPNFDENIDLIDLSTVEDDVSLFAFGYLSTDMNGDGNVDLLDTPLVENNINGFIFSSHP